MPSDPQGNLFRLATLAVASGQGAHGGGVASGGVFAGGGMVSIQSLAGAGSCMSISVGSGSVEGFLKTVEMESLPAASNATHMQPVPAPPPRPLAHFKTTNHKSEEPGGMWRGEASARERGPHANASQLLKQDASQLPHHPPMPQPESDSSMNQSSKAKTCRLEGRACSYL